METRKVCILIPNYNHGRGFETLVQKLLVHGLPLLVVNDGSDRATKNLLDALAARHAALTLLHLPLNRGKGGAVKVGLVHAWEQGFTHVLQIDADGQHDPADVPAFLARSAECPQAVINGWPVHDASIPALRKYCRYLTHVWVWVECLSLAIRDSMCGFRVYPLARVMEVLRRDRPGDRMDFDLEILVRLYWRGAEIVNLPTRVRYPPGGLSNFRLWQDNWLISRLHVRLVFGMLPRIPGLLRRHRRTGSTRHWAAIGERGSVLGMNVLLWIYRHMGRVPFLVLLHPVILYFTLFAGASRRASRLYLERLADYRGEGVRPGWRDSYAHFFAFGEAALDKIACWIGDIRRSDVTVHHPEVFQQVLDSGRGAVFLGSHLGNLEVCRALGEKGGRFRINALVFNKHALKFQQVLRASAPEVELNLIHVDGIGMDTAIRLRQKVEQGEIVIIVGDRTPVGSVGRVQYADFLGRPAAFSEGPFILAAMLGCPVYLLFCIKQAGRYNIYLEHFAESLKFPRAGRTESLRGKIQEYADRLGLHCLEAPLQWFNFYDFWRRENAGGILEVLAAPKEIP